jgi:hypothetical protein
MSTKMTIEEVREWRDRHYGYGPYQHYDVCQFAISQHEELERLHTAANELLHQIDIGDFVDSHGHSAKMLKPVHDLMRLLTPKVGD